MKHSALIKTLICLAFAAGVVFALGHFNWQQRMVGGIFVLTVGFWITGLLPFGLTALGSMALLILLAGLPENQAFSGLGDPVTPILISSLFLAKAIEVSGLGKRLAGKFVDLPWTRGRPAFLILNLILGSALLGMILPLPTVTAMMLPVCLSILDALGEERRRSGFGTSILIAIAIGPWISLATPVNNVLDIIALSELKNTVHDQISVGNWIVFGLPVTIALILIAWLVLWFLFCRGTEKFSLPVRDDHLSGKLSEAEKKTLWVIAIAFCFLFLPSLLGMFFARTSSYVEDLVNFRLPIAVVMSLSVLLLFILPVKDAPSGKILSWKQAVEIDWGLVLFIAGAISLGNAVSETGLAKEIGQSIAQAINSKELWQVTGISIFLGTFLSEFTNSVTAVTSITPLIINATQEAGIHPVAPVIGALFGINIGFAFPFSNISNAMIYATGLAPQKRMLVAGIIIGVMGMIVIFILLRLLMPLVGLA